MKFALTVHPLNFVLFYFSLPSLDEVGIQNDVKTRSKINTVDITQHHVAICNLY